MGKIGWTEVALIIGVVLLVFGPAKLSGLGKSVGRAISGFKEGLFDKDDKKTGD
ncbi:MAG: twin-arginine translocase TatA/TatE family subunit [Dethiobacteria bacterium]